MPNSPECYDNKEDRDLHDYTQNLYKFYNELHVREIDHLHVK